MRLDTASGKMAVDVEPDDTSQTAMVGRQIRELRELKRMTLRDVAELTGRSIGQLSQIERGNSEPTLRMMSDIAKALGVQIGWFFTNQQEVPPDELGIVVRKENRKMLKCVSGITDFLLSPSLSSEIELMLCEFEPDASSGDEDFMHEGVEAGLVLSGALALWVGDKHFVLEEGDSFSFQSTTPHRFKNVTASKTVVVWAVTPPSW